MKPFLAVRILVFAMLLLTISPVWAGKADKLTIAILSLIFWRQP
jgi:hypothetical protein